MAFLTDMLFVKNVNQSMKPTNTPGTSSEHDARLISHGVEHRVSLDERISSIEARIRSAGDLPGAEVSWQIDLLKQLSSSKVGRYLLEHRGLNAYWTHSLVTYSQKRHLKKPLPGLETFIYEKLPAVLATRERFQIFQQQLQGLIGPRTVLASVPCGFMSELLLLDYTHLPDVALVGIDLDHEALDGALALAKEHGLADRLSLRLEDAWEMRFVNEFDVLTSNGLNIYESDEARVNALYRSFFSALKPGGSLVTSFLTPPPTLSKDCPWNMAALDQESLALQQVLFVNLINAKWSVFRTHAQTITQLGNAGFINMRVFDDRARMFPTIVAQKPL